MIGLSIFLFLWAIGASAMVLASESEKRHNYRTYQRTAAELLNVDAILATAPPADAHPTREGKLLALVHLATKNACGPCALKTKRTGA